MSNPPIYVPNSSELPGGASLTRKASYAPASDPCMAAVTGKSDEAVYPAMYALPMPSTTIAVARSTPLEPPRYVLCSTAVPEALILVAKASAVPCRDAYGKPANRYHKRSKLDEKGQRSCTVKTEGEKNALGTVEVESDADNALADLRSPVTSLGEMGASARG